MRTLLPLLIGLALLAGCSSRERSNPLDPANPGTGGRPAGFNAIAGFDVVSLSWTAQPAIAIDGFMLQRLAPGDSLYRPVGPLFSTRTSAYVDLLVRNGALYRYRLYYVIGGVPVHAPAEDQATPGPLRPWVADAGAGALIRLSPDGRDVVASYTDAGAVEGLAVDPTDGRIWTASPDDGLVTLRLPDGQTPVLISGLGRPAEIAVSTQDQSAWICDLGGTLRHYSLTGTPLPGGLSTLDTPSGVAVSPLDFSVWVCENGDSTARHLNSIGALIAAAHVPRPRRVAVDSLTGQAWITSYDLHRVWRVSALGAVLDSSASPTGPVGIAVDPRRRNVWVAYPNAGTVVVLDPATMAVRFTVGGLPGAVDLDVDLATGEGWVVANSSGEIVRISPTGTVLQRMGGFNDPLEVRLDPGD